MFSSPLILGAPFEAELLKGVHNFLHHLTKLFCLLVAFPVLSCCIKGKRSPCANRPEGPAQHPSSSSHLAQQIMWHSQSCPGELRGMDRTWYTQLPAAAQPCSFSLALNESSPQYISSNITAGTWRDRLAPLGPQIKAAPLHSADFGSSLQLQVPPHKTTLNNAKTYSSYQTLQWSNS